MSDYNLPVGTWLAVWGFADGREVGLISHHSDEMAASDAVYVFWSRNPTCGAWVRQVSETVEVIRE